MERFLGFPLGVTERYFGGHEQRSSLCSCAEAFTSIAKPKCHDIKYLPVELKFVVSIISSQTAKVMFGDAFFRNVLELSVTL